MGTVFDIEARIEAAALELLRAFAPLTDLVPKKMMTCRDASSVADYPAVWVNGVGFSQFGRHTGWYTGSLQLGATTYRADDKDQSSAKRILGALRAWAQQVDLVRQINATESAGAIDTEIEVRDAECDGTPFDFSDEKRIELILPVTILCRPSRTTTS